MAKLIGLDFETYGACDLPTHGLDRYTAHPSFRPLIGATYDGLTDWDFDFVMGTPTREIDRLRTVIDGKLIAAHNAAFEHEVLYHLGIERQASSMLDSAVVARGAGASSSLAQSAPQLLDGSIKHEEGRNLIRLFSIPGKYQEANSSDEFDPDIVVAHPVEWEDFSRYCAQDARLCYTLAANYENWLSPQELKYQALTIEMNQAGWHVDLDVVHAMLGKYEANKEATLLQFREKYDHLAELNFRSFPQLKKFCENRGVKAKSFDEKNVSKYLTAINGRLAKGGLTPEQYDRLFQVKAMLETKQVLGGSSLSKLQTIINLTGEDGRLRHQYLHVGAGQTYRTSGKGVQMQNLKRLSYIRDVETIGIDEDWTNDDMAENLRQVFKAEHPDGLLIVGDFSSVESRGLAYEAGEEWKLSAFRKGQDLYKVLASNIYATPYDMVTKTQRQTGKVGELSCGYGAGGGAVKSFAENMGVIFTEGEAAKLVSDWRAANPMVLDLWAKLDMGLKMVVESGHASHRVTLAHGLVVGFEVVHTPPSLKTVHPGAQSVAMRVYTADNKATPMFSRYFHGCYMRGNNVGLYKPSDNKTGPLWKNHFKDPKTGEVRFYTLYGGKLAGLLTQSLCREIFFNSLLMLKDSLAGVTNVKMVGQFHDEIVLEWTPPQGTGSTWGNELTLEATEARLTSAMTNPGRLSGFPLGADIKHDHRYTK